MPEIIITVGPAPGQGDTGVTMRERLTASDFESDRFAANLLERIEWAVEDALELERRGPITGRVLPRKPGPSAEPEPDPDRDQMPEPAGIA